MNNFIYLKGNLVKDIEQRFTPSGKPVVNGYMASNDTETGKDGKEYKKTVFMAFTKYGKYDGKKGDQVAIMGKLRQWKHKETGDEQTAVDAEELYIHSKEAKADNPPDFNDEDIPFK